MTLKYFTNMTRTICFTCDIVIDLIYRVSGAIVKNIFCYENLFREVISPAIDCPDNHNIRQQGVRLLSLILDKIDEIFSMKIFDESSDSLKSVLSALSGRLPNVKSVAAFWHLEVEHLAGKDKVQKWNMYFSFE